MDKSHVSHKNPSAPNRDMFTERDVVRVTRRSSTCLTVGLLLPSDFRFHCVAIDPFIACPRENGYYGEYKTGEVKEIAKLFFKSWQPSKKAIAAFQI
ncbi:hypothetical protein JTE90_011238 [Oedothorax gibbosus]|uniref:Uncharacterized protein n=1 Tax=Oedothorax gibbosus TaxID=931172 RepID=A0AAV6VX35_9ARAC|nr:hypothetical protein JTE90_011238 [Oedothorax gibbosus]